MIDKIGPNGYIVTIIFGLVFDWLIISRGAIGFVLLYSLRWFAALHHSGALRHCVDLSGWRFCHGRGSLSFKKKSVATAATPSYDIEFILVDTAALWRLVDIDSKNTIKANLKVTASSAYIGLISD